MPLLQTTFAGLSILQFLLIATALVVALGLATAVGFFIARRYYKQDATQRVTLYQRELVRQKRRTTDGGSQSTLLRRERDRARRHVQRTVRLRQAAQARTEGRPDRRAYAPVNILRPMPLKQQSIAGTVYHAEGALNMVRESARSLVGAVIGRSKQHRDKVDDLTDDLLLPVEVEPAAVETPAPSRNAPMVPAAARFAASGGRMSEPGLSELQSPPARVKFVPEYEQMPTVNPTATAGYDDEEDDSRAPGAGMMAMAMAEPASPARHAMSAPAPVAVVPLSEPTRSQAPVGGPAPAVRASSSDLKRRLAQVRERSAAQRAQMAEAPARKSS